LKRYLYLALLYWFYPASRSLPEYRAAAYLVKRYCSSVIDMGCGRGALYRVLGGGVERYLCLDINRVFYRGLEACQGDASRPPVREGAFDCAVYVNSLFYIARAAGGVLGALSAAKDIGCRLAIIVDIDPSNPGVKLVDALERLGRLSRRGLVKLLEAAGAEVLEQGGSTTYYVVAGIRGLRFGLDPPAVGALDHDPDPPSAPVRRERAPPVLEHGRGGPQHVG